MNIAEWLHSLELPQYEQLFIDQAITLEVLPSLTNDDLKELGVVVLGHRKRMLLALAELSAQPSSAPNEQPALQIRTCPQPVKKRGRIRCFNSLKRSGLRKNSDSLINKESKKTWMSRSPERKR